MTNSSIVQPKILEDDDFDKEFSTAEPLTRPTDNHTPVTVIASQE